jgi:hypothetical protein
MIIITKRKLLLIIGIAITAISVGLGIWAAILAAPTTVKIIECLSKKDPNQTFTGPDIQGHLKDCALQYPYNPAAGPVFGISNLLFWVGIIIVVIAIIWIIRDWYVRRKTGRLGSKSYSSRYDK